MIVINERCKVDINMSRLSFLVIYITYCKLKKKRISNYQLNNRFIKSLEKKSSIKKIKIIMTTYYGGSSEDKNEHTSLERNEWLSNTTIDAYLSAVESRAGITVHNSAVALLLQGGEAQFQDHNFAHPSQWKGINLLPTIVRSSEYVGYHWVLLEINMDIRKIQLYDSMNSGKEYQKHLLERIASTLKTEVPPYTVWRTYINNTINQQTDGFNCGIYVTAWADSAMQTGEIRNCLKNGQELN